MSVYMTEEEQLKAIGQWFVKHSTKLTIMLSIILLMVSAYKYWNWHLDKTRQAGSNAYEHLMLAYSNQDSKAIKAYANELTSHFANTVYGDAAHLVLAKVAVSKEKYAKAKQELNFVVQHSGVSALKQIAKMRLARVFAAEKDYEGALKQLSQIDNDAYLPAVSELKGDIYASLGRFQEAVNAYQLAIKESNGQGVGNVFLEMKSNELAAMSEALTTATQTVQQTA